MLHTSSALAHPLVFRSDTPFQVELSSQTRRPTRVLRVIKMLRTKVFDPCNYVCDQSDSRGYVFTRGGARIYRNVQELRGIIIHLFDRANPKKRSVYIACAKRSTYSYEAVYCSLTSINFVPSMHWLAATYDCYSGRKRYPRDHSSIFVKSHLATSISRFRINSTISLNVRTSYLLISVLINT